MSNPASIPIRVAATNWSRTSSMSARVMMRGVWLAALHATSDAAISGQLPWSSGASIVSQPSWVDPLPPEWPSWRQNLRRRAGVDEVGDPPPRRDMLGRVHAGAAGRDPRIRRDAGHLGEHQPRAALGPRAIMDEVEIAGRSVGRRIGRHRRDDDAIGERQLAQRNGANIGGAALAVPVVRSQKAASVWPSHAPSRSRRFSWLMRCERVSNE
jgi:hypothetical protein